MILARHILYRYVCDGCEITADRGRSFAEVMVRDTYEPGKVLVGECKKLEDAPPVAGWTAVRVPGDPVTHHYCPACAKKRRPLRVVQGGRA